jgi:dolichol-phosphate mannosyltransferase
MADESPILEILLPIHNEAETIERTIREIYDVVSARVDFRFIICEDGSIDNTKQVLTRLSESLPMKLVMSDHRKGYSQAVIDGMRVLEADYLLCLDSDGQCDPGDFGKFWETREKQDVAIGWRVKRADTLLRRVLSGGFYFLYQAFYRVPVHDPSCPFVLAQRKVIEKVLPELGEMKEGFWWEFTARVHRRGFSLREFQVSHRTRSAGETQVYRLKKMPGIGYHHILALFKIWRQTRSSPKLNGS